MAVTKEEKFEGGRQASGATTPPEGGWGWMIVASCFLATICIRAVTRCVSMFFVEFQLHFEKDYSSTAWIHSLIDSTTMLCAPLGGFLGNHLSCRGTVILGGLLSSTGLVLSSFASSLEHLYVSLGIVTGLGFALSYTPAIAMVGRYFNERKALAYGIALSGSYIFTYLLLCFLVIHTLCSHPLFTFLLTSSFFFYLFSAVLLILFGSSSTHASSTLLASFHSIKSSFTSSSGTGIGTFILAPAVQLLIEYYSWRGALLVLGGFVSNLCVCGALMRPLEPKGGKRMLEKDMANLEKDCITVNTKTLSRCHSVCLEFREEFGFLMLPDFLILSVSLLFLAYGCSAPLVYLVPYSLSVGVGHQQAAFLMSIFGVSGILGNITFGWITDRKCLKKYRMLSYIVAIGLEGLCCMFIPLLHSFSLLVPFSIFYGYFDGAYVALIPVVTSDVVGSTYLTSALGVVYFLHAIPYLVSPPIGGWLVDSTGNYTATFFLSGASFMFSSVVLASALLVRRCQRSKSNSTAHLSPNHITPAASQQGII